MKNKYNFALFLILLGIVIPIGVMIEDMVNMDDNPKKEAVKEKESPKKFLREKDSPNEFDQVYGKDTIRFTKWVSPGTTDTSYFVATLKPFLPIISLEKTCCNHLPNDRIYRGRTKYLAFTVSLEKHVPFKQEAKIVAHDFRLESGKSVLTLDDSEKLFAEEAQKKVPEIRDFLKPL